MGTLSGVLLALLLLLSATVSADCAPNRGGEVFCGAGDCVSDRGGVIGCSKFRDGGAQLTRDGEAMCGKGQCTRDPRDRVFCSTEVGGAAVRETKGRVRCYGQCEPAKAEWCENSLAASSG
jgi:hypothetical protein